VSLVQYGELCSELIKESTMILRLLLALLMCGPNIIASAEPGAPQSAILQAARTFLGTLDPVEKSQAMFPFDSEERFRWFYTPVPRKGISLPRAALRRLLTTNEPPTIPGWREPPR
jgi:Protein of unknown function (DUF3500)